MRRIKTTNINTQEYWDNFATKEYMEKDIARGGSVCKFSAIHDILPVDSSILDVGCLNGNLYHFFSPSTHLNSYHK